MSISIRVLLSAVCLILISGFTNCSKVGFATSKDAALSKSAFGDDATEDVVRGEDDDDPTSDSTRAYLAVDIERVCSDSDTQSGGNVQLASKVHFRIVGRDNSQCVDSVTNYRNDLINLETVTVQITCELADGEYSGEFFDPDLVNNRKNIGELKMVVKDGVASLRRAEMKVVYATNPENDKIEDSSLEDYARCEDHSSPLVVKLGDKDIELSSPLDGILFDILGERGGHVKKQISWPTDDSMAFIALPNLNGQVNGINELFGDNTKGPDGKFSAHGYEALAKHDSNNDGLINELDPVYFKLRLFIDKNRDGHSQQGELQLLKARGIKSIDLAFDASYAERDKYGNKILYKSVAETDKGFLLIFDIWFRHID